MQVISELIETLSSTDKSLEDALLKTKVLSYKIGEKKLAEWANFELNGYTDPNSIPDYRKIAGRVVVTATDGYTTRWSNYVAPLYHLPDEIRESLQIRKLGQSISALEHLAITDSNTLATTLAPEFCSFIGKGLNKGIYVESGQIEIAKSDIIQVITKIKSRLLDFILELNERIPSDTAEQSMKDVVKKIDTNRLFNNTMFGDNTTIIVGDNNSQSVQINIPCRDFSSLDKLLRENNVSDIDIQSLKHAIADDDKLAVDEQKQLGGNVKNWLKSMLSKAVDTSWQIEVSIAANLLTNALTKYYGWF